jgi:CheY-like chemotaxis protein
VTDPTKTGAELEVLLVEDNPGDVRLIERGFEAGRFENVLHVVTDGEAALEFLNRRGEYAGAPRPDVILLDLNLPRKSGHEVLEALNADPDLSRIPVIVITASRNRGDRIEAYSRHTNAYLTKPDDPTEFVDLVRTIESFWLSLVRLPSRSAEEK